MEKIEIKCRNCQDTWGVCKKCLKLQFLDIIQNSKDMPPEIHELINKHFWELV